MKVLKLTTSLIEASDKLTGHDNDKAVEKRKGHGGRGGCLVYTLSSLEPEKFKFKSQLCSLAV